MAYTSVHTRRQLMSLRIPYGGFIDVKRLLVVKTRRFSMCKEREKGMKTQEIKGYTYCGSPVLLNTRTLWGPSSIRKHGVSQLPGLDLGD